MDGWPDDGYGGAIIHIEENDKGEFWVNNEEYSTRINYCPKCGEPATSIYNQKRKVKPEGESENPNQS